VAISLLLVAVSSACGGGDAKDAAPGEPSQSGSASTSPSTSPSGDAAPQSTSAAPVADAEHAVDPPGKRDGRLWSADILIQWAQPLSDETVRSIAKLKGVAHVERVGLGQVGIEIRVLTIAAVDPAA